MPPPGLSHSSCRSASACVSRPCGAMYERTDSSAGCTPSSEASLAIIVPSKRAACPGPKLGSACPGRGCVSSSPTLLSSTSRGPSGRSRPGEGPMPSQLKASYVSTHSSTDASTIAPASAPALPCASAGSAEPSEGARRSARKKATLSDRNESLGGIRQELGRERRLEHSLRLDHQQADATVAHPRARLQREAVLARGDVGHPARKEPHRRLAPLGAPRALVQLRQARTEPALNRHRRGERRFAADPEQPAARAGADGDERGQVCLAVQPALVRHQDRVTHDEGLARGERLCRQIRHVVRHHTPEELVHLRPHRGEGAQHLGTADRAVGFEVEEGDQHTRRAELAVEGPHHLGSRAVAAHHVRFGATRQSVDAKQRVAPLPKVALPNR
eukprot:scaffold36288_cov110-Isochrysis_galbana.AAC.3